MQLIKLYQPFFDANNWAHVLTSGQDWMMILTLILMECLLSVDNAVVLAAQTQVLPTKDEQRKSLVYGLWGAYLFRFIVIGIGTYLINFWEIKLLGGLYLLYLVYKYFYDVRHPQEVAQKEKAKNTHKKRHSKIKKHHLSLFWRTVISIESMDIVFSIDSVLAALAMSNNPVVVLVGGIGYENLELDPQREVNIIATNLGGFARMLSTAYRYFRDNGISGHIAAVTSVAGTNGIGRLSAYSSSKKGAQAYMVALEQLANEEGAKVSFTDIRPGWIRTPLLRPGLKYPMEMDLDYAVPQIIKAIVRHPRVAVVDWRWNIVVGLWRLVPNMVWTKVRMKISTPDIPLPRPSSHPFVSTDSEREESRHKDNIV